MYKYKFIIYSKIEDYLYIIIIKLLYIINVILLLLWFIKKMGGCIYTVYCLYTLKQINKI